MMVVISCLTSIPFVVFAFIYFRVETVNTALTWALIAIVLVLVLGGFILFRRTVEHIEQLSSALSVAEEVDVKGIQKRAEIRELAIIADTFNRTLVKLEESAKELGLRALQIATLNDLTVSYVNNLDKTWCRSVNLKGNYGAHTLRKTFGYVQRTVYGVGFEVLAKRFNHSNPRITMRYLGITDAEVNGILLNKI